MFHFYSWNIMSLSKSNISQKQDWALHSLDAFTLFLDLVRKPARSKKAH